MSTKTIGYSELFFGDVHKVRERLAEAVIGRLKGSEDFDRIDALCGFSEDKPGLPTCRQVQTDEQLLRCAFFSRAAFPLRLTVDDVLPLDEQKITPQFLTQVKEEMIKEGARAISGFPADPSDQHQKTEALSIQSDALPSDEEARVYIWLEIMDEIDVEDETRSTRSLDLAK